MKYSTKSYCQCGFSHKKGMTVAMRLELSKFLKLFRRLDWKVYPYNLAYTAYNKEEKFMSAGLYSLLGEAK